MRETRKDFALLREKEPWAYLDNAATSQKPDCVLMAMRDFYENSNANPHRGAYALAERATTQYESAREKVRAFIGAKNTSEIIFTKNTTEGINLVALTWGEQNIEAGDEIVVAISEHHSNLLPWQALAKRKGAELVFLETDKNGVIIDAEIEKKIGEKTKLVAVAQIPNVTGVINPLEKIVKRARKMDAKILVDAAQSVGHFRIDAKQMGADFLAFSGHKMFGPLGIGVLYMRKEIVEHTAPLFLGGGMIEYVERENVSFAPAPQKFEAGTPNVAGVIGLTAAIDYLEDLGLDKIWEHETNLTRYLIDELTKIKGLKIIGLNDTADRSGVVSFNLKNIHPHDVATILGENKIAIRAGHHCAQPLMAHLGLNASCRASLGIYNNEADVDRLAKTLTAIQARFAR